jgi:hypothetical protein
MTLRPAGTATYDRLTKGLLLEIGDDTYVVPPHHLAALTSRRANCAPVSRRYPGTAGRYVDVETQLTLRRSRSGRGLKFWTPNETFVMSRDEMIAVAREKSDAATISRIVTDAEQLSDATSQQMALEGS